MPVGTTNIKDDELRVILGLPNWEKWQLDQLAKRLKELREFRWYTKQGKQYSTPEPIQGDIQRILNFLEGV